MSITCVDLIKIETKSFSGEASGIFVNNQNADREKCGEIIVHYPSTFLFVCCSCKKEFNTMQLFGVHWKEKHQQEKTDGTKVHHNEHAFETINVGMDFPDVDCCNFDESQSSPNDLEASVISTVPQDNETVDVLKTEGSNNFCIPCNKRFSSGIGYSNHIRAQHEIPDDMKCTFCGRICSNSSEYIQHSSSHKGQKKYVCPRCPSTFASANSRQTHLHLHAGELPHQCPYCPKAFRSKYTLQNHVRVHLNQKQHSCDFCGKGYVRKSDLTTHLRSHTGERPYQCEECGKSYIFKSKLNEHLKRHTGIRDFKCEVCGKSFFSKYILQQHEVKHSDARPFACEICGKSFPRSKALLIHMKLHSEVKEYVCNICGKAFAQNSGLHGHRKMHGKSLA